MVTCSLLWYNTAFTQFFGGVKDGYNMASYINPTNIYVGGFKDGHSVSTYTSNTNIFAGGNKDGHAVSSATSSTNIYTGGNKDGHTATLFTNSTNIWAGGDKDGYASVTEKKEFIWTGAIGDGWNVAGNWNDGFIPTINSPVIIPGGVPNFPKINAGIMSIGADLNGGLFLCEDIIIQEDAELTFRVNAFLENAGSMIIHGTVYGLNGDPLAIQNLSGGKITIKSTGSLIIQE